MAERLLYTQKAVGSIPTLPIFKSGENYLGHKNMKLVGD